MAWRNQTEGGSARTDDSRGPKPTRAWQSTGPGEHLFNGLTPQPAPRQGESTRLYRRARVTAS
ncbi:hypothetical protein ACFXAS_05625 [Streptomyces sp. NPDC059459]|uniref:hypothetical protein n=1 Tax=Streptomyces sp. NPDC059459 TaxID=3346839 RepID=UPI0036A0008F